MLFIFYFIIFLRVWLCRNGPTTRVRPGPRGRGCADGVACVCAKPRLCDVLRALQPRGHRRGVRVGAGRGGRVARVRRRRGGGREGGAVAAGQQDTRGLGRRGRGGAPDAGPRVHAAGLHAVVPLEELLVPQRDHGQVRGGRVLHRGLLPSLSRQRKRTCLSSCT